MKDYLTILTQKIIGMTADKIDANDLYECPTRNIDSSLTFDEFYKDVEKDDPELAAQIDKWFLKNAAIKLRTILSDKNIIDSDTAITAEQYYKNHKSSNTNKPKANTPKYVEDPCRRFGGVTYNRC